MSLTHSYVLKKHLPKTKFNDRKKENKVDVIFDLHKCANHNIKVPFKKKVGSIISFVLVKTII